MECKKTRISRNYHRIEIHDTIFSAKNFLKKEIKQLGKAKISFNLKINFINNIIIIIKLLHVNTVYSLVIFLVFLKFF